jgi:hypothetical protein
MATPEQNGSPQLVQSQDWWMHKFLASEAKYGLLAAPKATPRQQQYWSQNASASILSRSRDAYFPPKAFVISANWGLSFSFPLPSVNDIA